MIRIFSRTALPAAFILLLAGAVGPGRGLAAATPPASSGDEAAIDWQPFDTSTFEAARKQNKLVMLSILAPWGHWDRIMSEITFRDPAVVSLVNDRFIPVKIDAEERPDIDMRYGMGGWPSTSFILPTGQPIYLPDDSGKIIRAGGTYYSPELLASYLAKLADYYDANREAAEKSAGEIADAALARKEVGEAPVKPDLIEVSVTKVLEAYGNWWPDPKMKTTRHPDPDSIELGFAYYQRKGNKDLLDMGMGLLVDMARGGIRDQIGGGFHRYAFDAAWRVPAFEKTLVTNADLLVAYSDAYKLSDNDRYLWIADGIAGYMMGTLRDPQGWFYAYQAADSRIGEDGDYYTWTLPEAKAVLDDEEQKILLPMYDIGEWGEMANSAPRRNVLFVSEGPVVQSERLGMDIKKVNAIIESGVGKLLAAREKRPAPPVGRVLLADANAAAAAALITVGDAWSRDDLREAGLALVDRLWNETRDPASGLLDHVWRPGSGRAGLGIFFSDQVRMVRALIAAYESTGRPNDLAHAQQLARLANGAFSDSLDGGWLDRVSQSDAPGLLSWPSRSIRDNAQFAEALLRLHYLTAEADDGEWIKAARKGLESWADEFAAYKEAGSCFGLAAARLLTPPLEVLIVGDPAEDGYDALQKAAVKLYNPWRIIRRMDAAGAEARPLPASVEVEKAPAVVFCRKDDCAGPFAEADGLKKALLDFLYPRPATDAGKTTGEGSPEKKP